jgi:hypothetical protein
MRKADRERIEQLEAVNRITNKRLWILEHPPLYAFNDKVKIKMVQRGEFIDDITRNYHEPVYKTVEGIYKGVSCVITEAYCFNRVYNIEYENKIIQIKEDNLLETVK